MGGSTTASAGDGRVRAPYIGHVYGPEMHRLMLEIKKIFDPFGILNRGVKTADANEVKASLRSEYSRSRHEHLPRAYCTTRRPTQTCPSPRFVQVLYRFLYNLLSQLQYRLYIRLAREFWFNTVIETGLQDGMIDLNRSLADLVRRGEITIENAYLHSLNPKILEKLL